MSSKSSTWVLCLQTFNPCEQTGKNPSEIQKNPKQSWNVDRVWSSAATVSLYGSAPADLHFFLVLTWLQVLLQYFTSCPHLYYPEQITVICKLCYHTCYCLLTSLINMFNIWGHHTTLLLTSLSSLWKLLCAFHFLSLNRSWVLLRTYPIGGLIF